jgi:hypothetical protein
MSLFLQLSSSVNFYEIAYKLWESKDNSVGIPTGYGLYDPGLIPGSARLISSPQLSDLLLSPPSLLTDGSWRLLLRR